MKEEPVRVIAYAGGRGEESPRAFFPGEERVEVAEILESWIGEGQDERERRRFFRVKGSDGCEHLLSFDDTLKVWFRRLGRTRSR